MSHGKQHNFMSDKLIVPIAIAIDNSPWTAIVPDFPVIIITADSIEETLLLAVDPIVDAIEEHHKEGWHIPDLGGIDYWRTHEDYVDGNWIWAVVAVPRPDWWPHATNI